MLSAVVKKLRGTLQIEPVSKAKPKATKAA
jgi:hypothetical protein